MAHGPQLLTSAAGRALLPAAAVAQETPEGWIILDLPVGSSGDDPAGGWRVHFNAEITFLYRPAEFRAKAIFIDMDSTLIVEESLDELARLRGCYEEVATITAEAMTGKLPFAQALAMRMRLLHGVRLTSIKGLAEGFTVAPGAKALVASCGRHGVAVHLVTGALLPMAEVVAARLGIKSVHASVVGIRNGVLEEVINVADGASKAAFVRQVMEREGLGRLEVIAIGDGANDRFMMQEVGVSVGYSPKAALYPFINSINNTGAHRIVEWLVKPL